MKSGVLEANYKMTIMNNTPERLRHTSRLISKSIVSSQSTSGIFASDNMKPRIIDIWLIGGTWISD
jgi:hypothetical protein